MTKNEVYQRLIGLRNQMREADKLLLEIMLHPEITPEQLQEVRRKAQESRAKYYEVRDKVLAKYGLPFGARHANIFDIQQ